MTTTPREVPVREAEIERIAAMLPDAISAGGDTVRLTGPYRGLLAKRLYDAGLRSQQYLDGLVAAAAALIDALDGEAEHESVIRLLMRRMPEVGNLRTILEGARATDDEGQR